MLCENSGHGPLAAQRMSVRYAEELMFQKPSFLERSRDVQMSGTANIKGPPSFRNQQFEISGQSAFQQFEALAG
jgi:hypothetical protein